MNFQSFDQLPVFIEAGYSGLWVVTHESDECQEAIVSRCDSLTHGFLFWDCVRGLNPIGNFPCPRDPKSNTPMFPLTCSLPTDVKERVVVFLHNFHKFLDNPLISQALHNAIHRGKSEGHHFIILSPSSTVPLEVQKDVALFDYPLPTLHEIKAIATSLDADQQDIQPSILEAARGMTRREVENSLALSFRSYGYYDNPFISKIKATTIAKSGVLTLEFPQTSFNDLAGLEGAKSLIKKVCSPNPLGIRPKGTLLFGVPGGGKSHLARASARATNRPLFRLDIGRLLHKHVGESEANLRLALDTINAVGKSLVFVDEGEKAFAGASSSDGDSGVMRRLFGTLLTWMEERTCDAFLIFTSNNVSQLPPEFMRAGRWNFEMFVDLPTPEERDAIWQIYLTQFKLTDKVDFSTDGWVGAEIKAACELAVLLQIPLTEAAKKVRITSKANPEQLVSLREYAAKSCCLSATTGEMYSLAPTKPQEKQKGRKINTNPSNN